MIEPNITKLYPLTGVGLIFIFNILALGFIHLLFFFCFFLKSGPLHKTIDTKQYGLPISLLQISEKISQHRGAKEIQYSILVFAILTSPTLRFIFTFALNIGQKAVFTRILPHSAHFHLQYSPINSHYSYYICHYFCTRAIMSHYFTSILLFDIQK